MTKQTLARPDNDEYRQFLETIVSLYRRACSYQKDGRLKPPGRAKKVIELTAALDAATEDRIFSDTVPVDEIDADYVRLVKELSLLGGQGELFTFIENPEIPGTNNISERQLRDSTTSRKTNRTSKTISGARRRTTIVSVLESLRASLKEFTLDSIITEIKTWLTSGETLFHQLLTKQGLPPPNSSKLDALFPAA